MFQFINVRYKNILDIPQLVIRKEKVTYIIGESGSGKTTLLKLLNDMNSPDSGSIMYCDKPISSYDPVQLRREVVMLAQNPPIFEGTVRDNLLIGLNFSEQKKVDDKELECALSNVLLHIGLDNPIETLSGGEKQRLAIARVSLMKPKVYLLDEPTSALDENTAKTVMSQLLKDARQQQQTVIIITHSRKLAEETADDIIEVRKGNGVLRKELLR